MKLTPQTELLIGIAVIVVVALAVVGLLIVPQFGALADLDAQMRKADQDVQSAQSTLTQRQSAKNQAAQTQAELMTLQNQVPDSPELPTLIIELQNAADDAGLQWVKVEPTTPENRDGYAAIPVQVTLTGSWADAVDYVRRISRLERQIRLTAVKVVPETDPNQQQATAGEDEGSTTTTSEEESGPIPLTSTIQLEAYVIGVMSGSAQAPGGTSGSSAATGTGQ